MSTNDVPGANPANNDVLALGCWAEHEDGSLVFVMSVEGGRVVYSIFDMSVEPVVEYRDSMLQGAFERQFSYDDRQSDQIKWTWHDKTPFPWERVIKKGATSGVKYASADDQLSAAERVAASRNLRGQDLDPSDYSHMTSQELVGEVFKRIQRAIGRLDP